MNPTTAAAKAGKAEANSASLTEEQRRGVAALFDHYDQTGDGVLHLPLVIKIAEDLSLGLWKSQVEASMEEVCKTKDPLAVSKDEFVALVIELKRRSIILKDLKWDLQFMMAPTRRELVTPPSVRLLAKLYKGSDYSDQDVDAFLKMYGTAEGQNVGIEDFELYITRKGPLKIVSPAQLD